MMRFDDNTTIQGIGAGFCAVLLALGPVEFVAAQCNYSVQIIQGPSCGMNPASVSAWGLDASGNVVGHYACSSGNDRAFRWSAQDGFITLPIPPNTESSRAVGIVNNRIVGHYNVIDDGLGYLGFILEGTDLTTLFPAAPYNWVEPNAINGKGAVVGAYGHNGTGPFPRAFLWNGAFLDVHANLDGDSSTAYDINDNGAITGWMDNTAFPYTYRAYIWDDGKVTDLGYPFPGCFATEGRAISNQNHVAGVWWYEIPDPPFFARRGFLWDGTQMIDIGGAPGFNDIYVADLTDSDQIVGSVGQSSSGGSGPGFIWQNGVFTLLQDHIIPPNQHYIRSGRATTEEGVIVAHGGTFPFTSYTRAVLLSPVPPEPGDVNCDHLVNVNDLLSVIGAWGQGNVIQDLNQDGTVNVSDLLIVIGNWGQS